MTVATNEPIYEVLKKVQEDVSQTRQDVRHVREELIATRGHLLALQKDANNIYERMTTLENKVDRIERRLELTDGTCLGGGNSAGEPAALLLVTARP